MSDSVIDPGFDFVELDALRSDFLNLRSITEDCPFYSEANKDEFVLQLGPYLLAERSFPSPSAALNWVHTHPVSIALAVYSICREIDLQNDVSSQS